LINDVTSGDGAETLVDVDDVKTTVIDEEAADHTDAEETIKEGDVHDAYQRDNEGILLFNA